MKLRYGIISTASIVPRFMKGIELSDNGVIEAIASRNVEKARELAEKFNVKKAYGSYKDIFEDKDINIVYISTPNNLHYEHSMDALKHGKHVVCEKPFALSKRQAKELFDFAEKQNLFIMEAQKIVFLPISQWLKKAIGKNKIGVIRHVNLTSSFPEGEDKGHWMYSDDQGGGVFYGSASYTIEYMQYLFDLPITKYSALSIVGESGVDEIGTLNLNLANSIHVSSTISRLVPTEQVAIFYGSKGRIEIPYFWKSNQAKILFNNQECEEIDLEFESEFTYEVNHINDCIEKGRLTSPLITKEMTLTCVGIVEEITKRNN